jgi:hypothetical protein
MISRSQMGKQLTGDRMPIKKDSIRKMAGGLDSASGVSPAGLAALSAMFGAPVTAPSSGATGMAEGGQVKGQRITPGFLNYLQNFYEESYGEPYPKKSKPEGEKEESIFDLSFEEMLAGLESDPTEGMNEFQKEVYLSTDITPAIAEQILQYLPELRGRVEGGVDDFNLDNAIEAFSRYEDILKNTAYSR